MLRRSRSSFDLSQVAKGVEEVQVPKATQNASQFAGSSGDFSLVSQDFGHLLSTQVAPESQLETYVYPCCAARKEVLSEDDLATQVYDFGAGSSNAEQEGTQAYDFADVRSQIVDIMQVAQIVDITDDVTHVRRRRRRWRAGVLQECPLRKNANTGYVQEFASASTDPE